MIWVSIFVTCAVSVQVQGQVVNAHGGFEAGFGVPVSTVDDSLNVLKAVYMSVCMLIIKHIGV